MDHLASVKALSLFTPGVGIGPGGNGSPAERCALQKMTNCRKRAKRATVKIFRFGNLKKDENLKRHTKKYIIQTLLEVFQITFGFIK